MSRALLAAIAQAGRAANDAAPQFDFCTVTAWASPLAEIEMGGQPVKNIRALRSARADIAVGRLVLVLTTGSQAVIVGVLD